MVREIEKLYDKEEILELYINSIYYGEGYYCIYDASMGYFGKIPAELSDSECVLLKSEEYCPMLYNAADSEFVPLLAALEFPPLPAHKFDILHTPRTLM